MPVYEYICPRCGKKFKHRRKVDEKDSELKCPVCGKERPRKLFCAFGTLRASSAGTAHPPSIPT